MATHTLTGYRISAQSLGQNFDSYVNDQGETIYYIQVENTRIEVMKGDDGNYYVWDKLFANSGRMIKKIDQQLARTNLTNDERVLIEDKREKILSMRSDDTQTFQWTTG